MDEETWHLFALWGILHHTGWAIARNREIELSQADTTLMQAAVMTLVSIVKEPMTPSELSRWLFREPQTVSSLLNTMEKNGLLRRVKDLDRRNMVRVELTEKGQETYARSLEKTETLREIMSCLSQEERSNLEAYLLKLMAAALKCLGVKYRFAPPSTRPYSAILPNQED